MDFYYIMQLNAIYVYKTVMWWNDSTIKDIHQSKKHGGI